MSNVSLTEKTKKNSATEPLLFFSVATVSLGLVILTWFAVQTAVDRNQKEDLLRETEKISSLVRTRLQTYADTLVFFRGKFIAEGVPAPFLHRKLVESMKLP